MVFSQVPVTCGSEVSVGCLASVQGFVSSPCPSLRLLAQTAAATLGLAAGSCLAVQWVVCTGVGSPLVPGGLAGPGARPGVECCCLGGCTAASRWELCLVCWFLGLILTMWKLPCLYLLLSFPEGLRSLPNCIFRLTHFIFPGAVLPSQVQDLGPARVGMTYFEVLCFLLKNI